MGDRLHIFDDDGHSLERNLRMHDNRDSDGEDAATSPKLEKKRIYQDNRIFQNERIKYDEQGHLIQDQIVYRDYVRKITAMLNPFFQMTFFNLTAKEYFGGSVLLLKNHHPSDGKGNGVTTGDEM